MRIRRWVEGDYDHLQTPRFPTGEHLAASGTAYTILENAAPIMIIGFVPLWKGCANVWATPSEEARGHSLQIVRLARTMLARCAQEFTLHRYQTLMNPEDPESLKWIRLLGFHHEATFKRAYPNGQDLLVYVRFFNEGEYDGRRTECTGSRLQRDVADLFRMDPRSISAV